MSDSDSSGESAQEREVVPPNDTSAPTIPFDATKMDLIIDFRSVCSLPHDPDTEGVKALRAITFGKGHGIHAPNAPGKIYVSGAWKKINALCKTYFVANTHRDPELLLGFVDYGFANSSMSGVSVETLALPLMVSKGVYQNSVRVTRIEDVAGFTPINAGQTPWSVNLKPTLLKQDMFKTFKIHAPADINKWLASQILEKRVEVLAARARSTMNDVLKDQARQDAPQAQKTKAIFEAKLTSILAAIEALPPSAYDVRFATRVEQLVEDRDIEKDPLWLTSPMAKGVREGTADFVRTRLHGAAAERPQAAATAPAPVISPVRPAVSLHLSDAEGNGELLFSNDEFSESGNSEVQEVEPPRESSRNKRAPSRLAEEQPTKAKKSKTPTAGATAAAKSPKLPKQKHSETYKRGKYNTNGTAAKAIKAAENKLKKEIGSADRLEIASLKLQVKNALEAKKVAEELLEQSKKMVELEIARAHAEGEKEGLRVAGEEYKKGIAAGAAIALGKPMTFAPQETPVRDSTSERSSTSFSGRSFGTL